MAKNQPPVEKLIGPDARPGRVAGGGWQVLLNASREWVYCMASGSVGTLRRRERRRDAAGCKAEAGTGTDATGAVPPPGCLRAEEAHRGAAARVGRALRKRGRGERGGPDLRSRARGRGSRAFPARGGGRPFRAPRELRHRGCHGQTGARLGEADAAVGPPRRRPRPRRPPLARHPVRALRHEQGATAPGRAVQLHRELACGQRRVRAGLPQLPRGGGCRQGIPPGAHRAGGAAAGRVLDDDLQRRRAARTLGHRGGARGAQLDPDRRAGEDRCPRRGGRTGRLDPRELRGGERRGRPAPQSGRTQAGSAGVGRY